MSTVYRVKQVSYINGRLLEPGALVVLPEGTEAGDNLEATEQTPDSPGVCLPASWSPPEPKTAKRARKAAEPEPEPQEGEF